MRGTFIDGASFDVVQSDGRFGACQFETIAAAQGDGTSAEGLRAAASAFILRRPNARVQYGARLISIAELTEQLAGLSSRDYALKLSKGGVWGDGASFAVACHIDGLRGHVLLPCGRDKLVVALACGPRDGRPLFARLACAHYDLLVPRWGVRSTTIAPPPPPRARQGAAFRPPRARRARPSGRCPRARGPRATRWSSRLRRRARRPPPRTRPRRRRSRWRRRPPTGCSARATNTRPSTSRCCRRSRHRSRRGFAASRGGSSRARRRPARVGDRAAAVGAPNGTTTPTRCGIATAASPTTCRPADELVQERRDASRADLLPGDEPLDDERQAIAASVAAFVSGDELRPSSTEARASAFAVSAAAPLAARAAAADDGAPRPPLGESPCEGDEQAPGDEPLQQAIAASLALTSSDELRPVSEARASTPAASAAAPLASAAAADDGAPRPPLGESLCEGEQYAPGGAPSRHALVASAAPASDDELSFEAPAASPGDVGETAVETRGDASFRADGRRRRERGRRRAAARRVARARRWNAAARARHGRGVTGRATACGGIDARATTTRARRGAQSSAKRRTRGARAAAAPSAWARRLGLLLLLLTCPLVGVHRPSSSTSLVGAGDRGRAPGAAQHLSRARARARLALQRQLRQL